MSNSIKKTVYRIIMRCSHHHKTAAHLCNSSWNLESPRRVACAHLRRARRKTSARANGKHETRDDLRRAISSGHITAADSIRIVRGDMVKLKKISFTLERNRATLRNGHVSVRTNVDDCRGENAPSISLRRCELPAARRITWLYSAYKIK